MDEIPLYKKVAESIRQEILRGEIKSGDRLPSIREMKKHWGCTPGTIQRAYQQLARQGLIVSHPGQGSRVASELPSNNEVPIRRANLVHKAEYFLLEAVTAGYSPEEIEQSVHLALDYFRTYKQHRKEQSPDNVIRISGSHDLALGWIASHFNNITTGKYSIDIKYTGSLAGLIALSEGKADLACCQRWDIESNTYNLPFIRKILPSIPCAVITLAHRRLGLICAPDIPYRIQGLFDVYNNSRIRFVNRQRGSGTRVWLDATLNKLDISPARLHGYRDEKLTHSELARTIAQGEADVGIGLEAAAIAYGLNFVLLTKERYDLVVPEKVFNTPQITSLIELIYSKRFTGILNKLGGYETGDSGKILWI